MRWERHKPMELWQLDVVGGIFLADGTELKALTGVDDYSRFCVVAGLMERATARAVHRLLGDAYRWAQARRWTRRDPLADIVLRDIVR